MVLLGPDFLLPSALSSPPLPARPSAKLDPASAWPSSDKASWEQQSFWATALLHIPRTRSDQTSGNRQASALASLSHLWVEKAHTCRRLTGNSPMPPNPSTGNGPNGWADLCLVQGYSTGEAVRSPVFAVRICACGGFSGEEVMGG